WIDVQFEEIGVFHGIIQMSSKMIQTAHDSTQARPSRRPYQVDSPTDPLSHNEAQKSQSNPEAQSKTCFVVPQSRKAEQDDFLSRRPKAPGARTRRGYQTIDRIVVYSIHPFQDLFCGVSGLA
ncbi:MAG: hypothetical protein ACHQKY_16895, partial [Terriglobia bacterium]